MFIKHLQHDVAMVLKHVDKFLKLLPSKIISVFLENGLVLMTDTNKQNETKVIIYGFQGNSASA